MLCVFIWAFYFLFATCLQHVLFGEKIQLKLISTIYNDKNMSRGNHTIQRCCEECGKIFTPSTLVSKYCFKRTYKKRQIAKEEEAQR